MLDLIVAVGRLRIDLYDAPACRRARVADGDGYGDRIRIEVRHGIERLREGRIAQPVPEGIDHLIGIVPCAAHRADSASRIIAIKHGVLVAGLIVLIPRIDALGEDHVVFRARVAHRLSRDIGDVIFIGRVGERLIVPRLHRRGGDCARGKRIDQSARGIRLPRQQINDAKRAL